MAMMCQRCGGIIPDIGGHACTSGAIGYVWPYAPPSQTYVRIVGCQQCGSTTIDHTEEQCSKNRGLHIPKPKSVKP